MKLLRIISFACLLVCGLGVNLASAAGPNPYRDCGIGSALFPNTAWAAVTSNVIWDVGTTAVISATASPDTCSGSSATAARFIFDAYENVAEDTAKGSGDYLSALLDIYKCDGAEVELVGSLREEVGVKIGDSGYQELSKLQKAEQYFLLIDSKVRAQKTGSCRA